MIALWDTTGTAVVKALAAERRNAGGVTSGLALTLVTVVDESRVREAESAAATAAAAHPCRLIIVVRGESPPADAGPSESHLDAEIMVGGRLGPCEGIVLRMRGRLVHHAESVVIPLLAPDVPVATWWHGIAPTRIAYDPLGVVADRRITDSLQSPDPIATLAQRAEDYAPGDTDLAWTRATPWRSCIASALDTADSAVVAATVRSAPEDPTGALLRGWLRSRLDIEPEARPDGPLVQGVSLRLASGAELVLERTDALTNLRQTGLPDRSLPLPRRQLGDQLAEELRRLDPDQTYSAALAALTGMAGLDERSGIRRHEWHDESATAGRVRMAETAVQVKPTPGELANDVAGRLLTRLKGALDERGSASVVLTGGRIAEQIYHAVRDSRARDSIDWRRVDVWWGDERFLPTGHPDRNETQARAQLLDALPLDPARIHAMPGSDVAADPEAAAAEYAAALAAAGPGGGDLPRFDVVLLSVGEDGHIASVFPDHPSINESRLVAGVRQSPKPPPERVTLTLPAINTADEVWLLASGSEKAAAVGTALNRGPAHLPAAAVHGIQRTLWLLDHAAATDVPPDLARLGVST